MAYRIIDPTNQNLIDYTWFKFIHNKGKIQAPMVADHNDYLMPIKLGDRIYVGSQRINSVWHYHNKEILEEIDARSFG